MRNLSVLAFTAFALVLGCNAQNPSEKQDANKEFWFSPMSSPLKLSFIMPGGRYLDLINVSDKSVVGYTLGCVFDTADGQQLEPNSINRALKPGGKGREREFHPGDGLAELKISYQEIYSDTCHNPASRLAVVKVQFADGTHWSLISQQR
jgi:hypothetical protein